MNLTQHRMATLWTTLAVSILALHANLWSRPSTSTLPEQIVLSSPTEPLEMFAAQELQRYLELVFRHKARIVSSGRILEHPPGSLLILGRPSAFPLLAELTQNVSWGASEQSYALVPARWRNRDALVLAGATAPAVLWAAYELVETWGVRFDLEGDRLPSRPTPSVRVSHPIMRQPAIPMRVLTGHNLHVEGPASWGLDDYRRFIDQAAKLRYNGYMFMLRDMGPWVDLSFRGLKKQKGDIYGGGWLKEYVITPDLIGHSHFKQEGGIFYNPWFRGLKTDRERIEAGPRLVRAVFEHARRRGMKTGLYFELANLPPEMKEGFARLTGKSDAYLGIPKEELYLKAKENVTHPLLWELIETKLRAIRETYPGVDFYEFGQMEHTSATADSLPLWEQLDRKYGIGSVLKLEEILTHADRYPVRRNFRENVMGEIEFLWLIDKIFIERQALGKLFPPHTQLLVGNGVTTLEFFPILPKIWPSQIQLAAWLEYGYHRAAAKLDVLDSLARHKTRAWINNALDEDNNLWLAQNTIEAIHKTVTAAVAAGIEGMEVGHWRIRDISPAARYMAESCWNPALTPEAFYSAYLQDRVGADAVKEVEQAFRMLERADRYTTVHLLGIAFCYPNRLEPYVNSPDSKNERALQESLRLYTQCWKMFEASLPRVSPTGRDFAQAWMNRADFSRRYLEMLLLARQLGLSLKSGSLDARAQSRQLAGRLVQHVRLMVELVATDILDRSDQGTLISLNYLLYQPALKIQARVLRDSSQGN